MNTNATKELIQCTITVEGLELDFVMPRVIANFFEGMRSDKIAGYIPIYLSHRTMNPVSECMKMKMREHAELLELSSSLVEVSNVKRYV